MLHGCSNFDGGRWAVTITLYAENGIKPTKSVFCLYGYRYQTVGFFLVRIWRKLEAYGAHLQCVYNELNADSLPPPSDN